MTPLATLRTIKVVHTLVWALFAGCILAIQVAAGSQRIRGAFVLIAIVSIEVVILLVNRMRCPLTTVATRYTQERHDNFDIYLPLWLARYNKHIFGSLFAISVLYTVAIWLGWID